MSRFYLSNEALKEAVCKGIKDETLQCFHRVSDSGRLLSYSACYVDYDGVVCAIGAALPSDVLTEVKNSGYNSYPINKIDHIVEFEDVYFADHVQSCHDGAAMYYGEPEGYRDLAGLKLLVGYDEWLETQS